RKDRPERGEQRAPKRDEVQADAQREPRKPKGDRPASEPRPPRPPRQEQAAKPAEDGTQRASEPAANAGTEGDPGRRRGRRGGRGRGERRGEAAPFLEQSDSASPATPAQLKQDSLALSEPVVRNDADAAAPP